jgi:hypothetical protein
MPGTWNNRTRRAARAKRFMDDPLSLGAVGFDFM